MTAPRRPHPLHSLTQRFLRRLLLGLAALLAAVPAIAEDSVRLGFYQATINELSRAEVRTTFDLWAQELGARFQVKVKFIYYDDPQALRQAFVDGEVDGITADVMTLTTHFRPDELADGYSVAIRGGFDIQLLAPNDTPQTGLEHLAGKRITLVEGDTIGAMFLETLCLRRYKRECSQVFSEIHTTPTNNQAVMRLFFGKADLALVHRYGIELARELNPQVGRKLGRVLAEFPVSSLFFAFYSPRLDKEFRRRTLRMIPTLHTYPRGRQLLDIFKMDHLSLADPSALRPFVELQREYRELKAGQPSRSGRK